MSILKKITILTGAGISSESGIPVFRSESGLWEQHRIEDVATYDGFKRNKTLVHDFYNHMRQNLKNIEPNAAHNALVELAYKWPRLVSGGEVTLITQNIDDLHERAHFIDEKGNLVLGAQVLPPIHMHGQLLSVSCECCGTTFKWFDDTTISLPCPKCNALAIRPNIVWFGEVPLFMDKIEEILMHTDLFVSIGTSGVVYPAAGFAAITRQAQAYNVELNLERSQVASGFQTGIYGKATSVVPKFVSELLAKGGDLSFLENNSI